MTKRRNLAKKKQQFRQLLTANFGGCKVSQSPYISCTDCPHQQQTFPSVLPTPRVVDKPPEFLSEGNRHVASWSEADNRGGSSSYWKEGTRVVEKSSFSFCAVVIQWRQRGLLQVDEPDPSGIALPFFSNVPLLLPISGPPLPIWLSRRLLLLFSFDALLILAPPVDGGDSQPLGNGGLISPHIAHRLNQRHWEGY